jgi:flagellar protein FliL
MAAMREEAKADPAAEKNAKDEAAEGTQATEGKPKSGRRKLLIIGAIVLLVAGIAGGAAYYFLHASAAQSEPEAAAAAPAHKQALYLSLRPDFIVNSTAVGQRRYLQTNVVVMARDQVVIDAVNTHAPIIRSAIINLLADEDFMVLQTDAGKQSLREKMRTTINATLKKEADVDGVEAVLFSSFVMQ